MMSTRALAYAILALSTLSSIHASIITSNQQQQYQHQFSTTRELEKKKSNDVGFILIPLLPFIVSLDAAGDNINVLKDEETMQQIIEVFNSIAIDIFNSSEYASRLDDVDLGTLHQLGEMGESDALNNDGTVISSYRTENISNSDVAEFSNNNGEDTTIYVMLAINATASFTGSYFEDDPLTEEISKLLVEGLNDNKEELVSMLLPVVCASDDGSGEVKVEERCLTVYSLEMQLYEGGAVADEGGEGDADATVGAIEEAANDSERNADDTDDNSELAWMIPTIIAGVLLVLIISTIIYRKKHQRQEREVFLQEQHEDFASSQDDEHDTSLHLGIHDGSFPVTTKNNNNIDQLLEDFASDSSYISSDPSEANTSMSGTSGFSSYLDQENGKNNNTGAFKLEDVAHTSSRQSTLSNNNSESVTSRATGGGYLPTSLRKQESFEGDYRSRSAMAKLSLKKDILQVAGESSNNGGMSRTKSSKRSHE